jgi:aspartate/methionine/tyrosine aminotransferase
MNTLMGESAFQVLAAANTLEAQGKRVIHFEIGEPDFPTPRHIVDAGKKALEAGQTRYCNAQGLLTLREAIAEHARTFKGLETNAAEVVVASGGKPIIFFTLCALINPGDEVIYPDPGFPTYESVIRYTGGIPVPIVLREENDFRMRVEELKEKITPRTKLLILNSPSNPTGSLLTEIDLSEIAAAAVKAGVFVLSDEIYSRIVYGDTTKSIATFPGMKERTVVLDGFSKTYCMTGWRLGYGIMHEELAEKMTRILINSCSCTPPFVQAAGIAALHGPQDSVEEMVAEFALRRDVIVSALNSIPGVACKKPNGAFYAYPNIKETGQSSGEVARYLLNEAGVALLDGTAFGSAGNGYLRLSFATSIGTIQEGLERIDAGLKKLADQRRSRAVQDRAKATIA